MSEKPYRLELRSCCGIDCAADIVGPRFEVNTETSEDWPVIVARLNELHADVERLRKALQEICVLYCRAFDAYCIAANARLGNEPEVLER